uniref:SRCR domain-containing protein n=1 Tax=Bubo bubo TaxID=30461 RepID=A0A8C0FD61_BUBBB
AALRPVSKFTEKPILRLTGGGCHCTGMLEVKWQGWWRRVCQDKASDEGADGICRRLGCGPTIPQPLQLIFTSKKEPPMLRCLWLAATSVECYRDVTNCTEPAIITCSEPVKTTPKPLPAPPATTPEPTGPDRLQLVDGDFGCSGYVELHRQGLWGSVADGPGIRPELATRICQDLRCALSASLHPRPPSPGSQPQALRRLAGGPTPCEGDVEVFHEGRWQVLCDNRAQRSNWGRQLCQELRCGNLSSSTELRDPPSMGVICKIPTLHLCSTSLRGPQTCSRTRVVCRDSKPQPAGTAAGTIVSICLALLLFGILSLLCGPPAYRRLMKRSSSVVVPPHPLPNSNTAVGRNSTVTPRPRAEGQRVQGGDNDYAQPPQKSSYLSAYPALEGACRASNPPDNSSDSDYDLHSARRV